jgi:hypothetical protein
MATSIKGALNRRISASELGAGTESAEGAVSFDEVVNVLEQYAILFEQNLSKVSKEVGNVASGDLLKSFDYQISPDGNTLQLFLADYYDYTNVGVKGMGAKGEGDSRNAPLSPYQYRNYGMNKEGRRSIRNYIQSGRAKIRDIEKTQYKRPGAEAKKRSLLDVNTDTLIYLIKRYGIKATRYLDKTIEITFKDIGEKLGEAVAKDITYTINTLNKK